MRVRTESGTVYRISEDSTGYHRAAPMFTVTRESETEPNRTMKVEEYVKTPFLSIAIGRRINIPGQLITTPVVEILED